MEETNKEISNKINSLHSQIAYLKSKRSKKCANCGKNFTPENMHRTYCSDECRRKGVKKAKHKYYIKSLQNPDFVEKRRQAARAWRERNGLSKPKSETVSIEEYKNYKEAYERLKQSYDKFFNEYKETVKETRSEDM